MSKARRRVTDLKGRKSNLSKKIQKIGKQLEKEPSDELRSRFDALEENILDLDRQITAAETALADEEAAQVVETRNDGGDPETRERLELRSKARLGRFLVAAMQGSIVSGAEAEYAAAEGCTSDRAIPLGMFDDARTENRADAATAAPGTVGVNLAPIRPAIFARAIAPRLGIEMPRVPSGTYAEGVITTDLTAGAKAAGGAAESTAAAITVASSTPKRISGRLGIRIEDIAAIGTGNFESALRMNLEQIMGDALDDAVINGTGASNQISGLLKKLTDPTAASAVVTWDTAWGIFAGAVDGKWASMTSEVGMLVNPATYQKLAALFRDAAGQDLGSVSLADYAQATSAGLWTNERMPDGSNTNVHAGIMYRTGQEGVRKACVPVWGEVNIDDVYSGSASGTRFLTMHILLGDLILNYASAFEQVSIKTA